MEEPQASPPPSPAPTPPRQAMDVVAPPPEESHPNPSPLARETPSTPAHQPAPAKPKDSKRGDGVKTAIIATVIIVLGLAALAVYAYIKTKK